MAKKTKKKRHDPRVMHVGRVTQDRAAYDALYERMMRASLGSAYDVVQPWHGVDRTELDNYDMKEN